MAISKRRKRAKPRYRSKLENTIAKLLPEDVAQRYETHKITYLVEHEYNPDWSVNDKLFIEAKGYFRASDRAKHLHLKQQHPEIEIVFIFGDANNKLNKNSKTTYADWCDKHGFRWTDLRQGIPKEWLNARKQSNKN